MTSIYFLDTYRVGCQTQCVVVFNSQNVCKAKLLELVLLTFQASIWRTDIAVSMNSLGPEDEL